MKKIVLMVMVACASICASAVNMNVHKTRTLTSIGGNSGSSIFRDCYSRHFYEIKLTVASVKDTESTYTIRILPIMKVCKGGSAFPYFPGVIEESGITLDTKKSYTCVYVSPLTKWTKDTWKDVGGDWSKGIVNSTVVIELLKDGEDKPIKTWTNCATPSLTKMNISNLKMSLKDGFVHWLDDSVYPTIEGRAWIDEVARIMVGNWKEMISKK